MFHEWPATLLLTDPAYRKKILWLLPTALLAFPSLAGMTLLAEKRSVNALGDVVLALVGPGYPSDCSAGGGRPGT